MKTIKEARQAGFKVRVGHFRLPEGFSKLQTRERRLVLSVLNLTTEEELGEITKKRIDPRGGYTTVDISKDDKHTFGVAHCNLTDNYCKKTGAELALKRALEIWHTL